MKKIPIALITLCAANVAFSQESAAWQIMPEITLNFVEQSGTPAQIRLAEALFKSQIRSVAAQSKDEGRSTPYPSFILLSTGKIKADDYALGMFSSIYDCDPPPNGPFPPGFIAPLYSTCPVVVFKLNKGKPELSQSRKVGDACYLHGTGDQPLKSNNTQIYFDPSGSIKLRVVQHGKPVPECSRSIRVE